MAIVFFLIVLGVLIAAWESDWETYFDFLLKFGSFLFKVSVPLLIIYVIFQSLVA